MDFNAQVTVRRTRFANQATGWAVVDAMDEDGDEIVLVGPLHHLEQRERVHVVGTWQDDSRFGLQVKVTQADPLPPSDAEALLAYLVRVRHVGPKRAASLLDRYGEAGVLEATAVAALAANASSSRRSSSLKAGPSSRRSTAIPRRHSGAPDSPAAGRARRPSRGTRCASRGACTCCSRRTGLPTWSPASGGSSATPPTGLSVSGRTS